MTTVFLFPGQSSASPDMLTRARRVHPAAGDIAIRAERVLGADLCARYCGDGGVTLETNHDVQVSMFLATQMYLHALLAEGVHAPASLGLSLGEYSHLVHIGALDFDDALALVHARGACYDRAPQGVMVTVLGVDRATVHEAVAQARGRGCAVVSNYNAATQHVIAGDDGAVAWAAAWLEDEHGAHTTVIERRVPMHSPLMAGVADAFTPALARAPWRTPALAYLPNVSACPVPAARPDDFVTHLAAHVSAPVRWDASVDLAAAIHPDALFVEVGPGAVLHNMLGRGWKALRRARVDAPDGVDPRDHFAALVEAVHAAG